MSTHDWRPLWEMGGGVSKWGLKVNMESGIAIFIFLRPKGQKYLVRVGLQINGSSPRDILFRW